MYFCDGKTEVFSRNSSLLEIILILYNSVENSCCVIPLWTLIHFSECFDEFKRTEFI